MGHQRDMDAVVGWVAHIRARLDQESYGERELANILIESSTLQLELQKRVRDATAMLSLLNELRRDVRHRYQVLTEPPEAES